MPFMSAKRTFMGFTAAALACLPWTGAEAQPRATATFSVTANVTTTCNINSTTNINFGNYAGTVLTSTGTIQVTCSNAVPYNIGLNAGTGAGATVTARKMSGPAADLLSYGLFQDAAFTTNWGDTIGTDTVAGTGTGAAQSYTVYGQLPGGQFVSPGTYDDTITTTLTF